MENELNKWGFLNELKKLPAKTRKLSSVKSRQIADDLFFKYSGIISANVKYLDDLKKRVSDQENIIKSLKTGKIHHSNGFIFIKEIVYMSKKENSIMVCMTNDHELNFDLSFEWILNI